MLHVLKSEVFLFLGGGEGVRRLGPLFLNFLGPPLIHTLCTLIYSLVKSETSQRNI